MNYTPVAILKVMHTKCFEPAVSKAHLYVIIRTKVQRLIRDFPDHATFREKGAKLACADKLGVFLSLTLCNKANFDPLQRVKYDGLEKM